MINNAIDRNNNIFNIFIYKRSSMINNIENQKKNLIKIILIIKTVTS